MGSTGQSVPKGTATPCAMNVCHEYAPSTRYSPRRSCAQRLSEMACAGCIEASTPKVAEAREVCRRDDLRVLDAVARFVARLPLTAHRAGIARAARSPLCAAAEAVERHAVGAVADAWSAIWKPAASRSTIIRVNSSGGMRGMPLLCGSSAKGASIAAVREPSVPST